MNTGQFAGEYWTFDDAWVFLAATMSGLTSVAALNNTADHMRHDRPGADLTSSTLTKLANSGLICYERDTLEATPRAIGMSKRARATRVSPWAPGGWIDRALDELRQLEPGLPAPVPNGYSSWYDVLERGHFSRRRRRFGLGRR